MSSSSETKKITLKSSDGENFKIDEAVAVQSQTIKHMIDDDCIKEFIPLPNVKSNIISKVIKYCKKHVVESIDVDSNSTTVTDEIKAFDTEFMKVLGSLTIRRQPNLESSVGVGFGEATKRLKLF